MHKLPVIYAISDLHLDTGPFAWPQAARDADIIVVAGDLANGEFDIDFLTQPGKPLIFVPGNHDFWDKTAARDMFDILAEMRAKAAGTQVHVLWDDSVVIDGVRFLGTPLWSSFGDFNDDLVRAAFCHNRDYQYIHAASWYAHPENMAKHREHPEDFTTRKGEDPAAVGAFTPLIAYDLHQKSVAWLEEALDEAFDGPTVLVTHMAPTYQSLRESGSVPEYRLDPANWEMRGMDNTELARVACYASDLGGLFDRYANVLDLAIHGHLHHSLDFACHSTRIVANPRGRYQAPLTSDAAKGFSLFGVHVSEEHIAQSAALYHAYPYRGDNYHFEPSKVFFLEDGLAPTLEPAVAEVTPYLQELLDGMRELVPYVAHETPVLRRSVQESADKRGAKFEALLGAVLKKAVGALHARDLRDHSSASQCFASLRLAEWVRSSQPHFEFASDDDEKNLHETLAHAISGMEESLRLLPKVPYAAEVARQEVAAVGVKVLDALRAKGFEVEARGAMTARYWRTIPFSHGEFVVSSAGTGLDELDVDADNIANGGKVPRRFIFWVREPDSEKQSSNTTLKGAYPASEW